MPSICPDCDGWVPDEPYKRVQPHDVPGTDGQERCEKGGIGETYMQAQARRTRAAEART